MFPWGIKIDSDLNWLNFNRTQKLQLYNEDLKF